MCALRSIVIRLQVNKLWVGGIIKVIEKTANVGLYHVTKVYFSCRLPFITSTKKIIVPRQYYAFFYLLISYFEKLNLVCTVKVRRKKANPKSPQSAFLFHFLHYP